MQIRGGTRGGKDQFEWEDVKVDKHRENYLGKSLKVSLVGQASYLNCGIVRSLIEGLRGQVAKREGFDMASAEFHLFSIVQCFFF